MNRYEIARHIPPPPPRPGDIISVKTWKEIDLAMNNTVTFQRATYISHSGNIATIESQETTHE